MKRDVPCHRCFLSFNDTALSLSLFVDGPLPRCPSLPVPPNRMSNWVIAGHQHLLCVCVCVPVHARWCCFTPSTQRTPRKVCFFARPYIDPRRVYVRCLRVVPRLLSPALSSPIGPSRCSPLRTPKARYFLAGVLRLSFHGFTFVSFIIPHRFLSLFSLSLSLSLILSLHLRGL